MSTRKDSQIEKEEKGRDTEVKRPISEEETSQSQDAGVGLEDQGHTAVDALKIGNVKADKISSKQQRDQVGRDHWQSP